MTIPCAVLVPFLCVYTVAVVLVDRWLLSKTKPGDIPVNKPPESTPELTEDEKIALPIYQTEWKTVIETQMHFNDLIIRFRSIVLTALVTLVGASVALGKTSLIDNTQIVTLIAILLVLWGTAFVLDYFYYHRLLLGSVAQALKFDESKLGKKLGLFGLTTCISRVVQPPTSKIIVGLFYGIPGTGIVFLMLYVYYAGG